MKPTMKAGLTLGVFVFLWTVIIGLTGWFKDPVMMNLFYLVIVIQILVLIWGLRMTAAEGRTYGGQVKAGILISLIGAVIVFFGSLLFATVLFPNYFEELREAGRQMYAAQGMTEEQIVAALEAQSALQTPLIQAIMGAVGTIVTGIVVSLVLAAFIRKPETPQRA